MRLIPVSFWIHLMRVGISRSTYQPLALTEDVVVLLLVPCFDRGCRSQWTPMPPQPGGAHVRGGCLTHASGRDVPGGGGVNTEMSALLSTSSDCDAASRVREIREVVMCSVVDRLRRSFD